jgi:hypothetical protein
MESNYVHVASAPGDGHSTSPRCAGRTREQHTRLTSPRAPSLTPPANALSSSFASCCSYFGKTLEFRHRVTGGSRANSPCCSTLPLSDLHRRHTRRPLPPSPSNSPCPSTLNYETPPLARAPSHHALRELPLPARGPAVTLRRLEAAVSESSCQLRRGTRTPLICSTQTTKDELTHASLPIPARFTSPAPGERVLEGYQLLVTLATVPHLRHSAARSEAFCVATNDAMSPNRLVHGRLISLALPRPPQSEPGAAPAALTAETNRWNAHSTTVTESCANTS